MLQQFPVNYKKQKEILKHQKRRSRAWKLNLPIRILFWLMLPAGYYFFYMLLRNTPHPSWMNTEEMILESVRFNTFTLTASVIGIPLICYYAILDRYILQHIKKKAEVLVLDDDGIQNMYIPFNKWGNWNSVKVRIYFNEIKKIEMYEYYEMVKIYAPVHYQCNYGRLSITQSREGVLEGEEAFRLFYDYYDFYKSFVEQVSEASNVGVERIEGKQKFIREGKLK